MLLVDLFSFLLGLFRHKEERLIRGANTGNTAGRPALPGSIRGSGSDGEKPDLRARLASS